MKKKIFLFAFAFMAFLSLPIQIDAMPVVIPMDISYDDPLDESFSG